MSIEDAIVIEAEPDFPVEEKEVGLKPEETHGTVKEQELPTMIFPEPNALEAEDSRGTVIKAEPEPVTRKKEVMIQPEPTRD